MGDKRGGCSKHGRHSIADVDASEWNEVEPDRGEEWVKDEVEATGALVHTTGPLAELNVNVLRRIIQWVRIYIFLLIFLLTQICWLFVTAILPKTRIKLIIFLTELINLRSWVSWLFLLLLLKFVFWKLHNGPVRGRDFNFEQINEF